ncbi:reticulon-4-interacting protein 1-like protein, partial [Dinothrombium tinctorium]
VLVLGGTGGVGSVAIQLLKAWGAYVVATCSADAIDWMHQNTNVDECIDYNSHQLATYEGTFDFVLDAATRNNLKTIDEQALRTLKKISKSKYVSITSPLLRTLDTQGLLFGSLTSLGKAGSDTFRGLRQGVSIRWAFFSPNPAALESIKDLVEKGQIKAIVEKVYSFNQLPDAYKKVQSGHARGKTVIQIDN